MRAEDIITLDYWMEHRDFDDYADLLYQHLDSIKDQLKPLDSKGHDTNTGIMYDRLKNGRFEDYMKGSLVRDLHMAAFYTLKLFARNDLAGQYQFFMDYLNNGFCPKDADAIEIFNSSRHGSDCYDTGKTMKLGFSEPFTPKLLELGPGYRWIEASTYTKPGVQHMIWDCPSGELIAADWIRIDALSDRSREMPYTEETSLNHAEGRINSAFRTNKEMNLLDISLGNMSVRVYQNGNQLIIGDDYSYDRNTDKETTAKHPDFKEAGEICTDRWTFTCIDRVHLEQIIKDAGSPDPKQVVDNYLAEKNHGVCQFKVTPGKYHVYFSGDYPAFNKQFNSPDFPLVDKFKYYTVISDKELALEPPQVAQELEPQL